MHATSDQPAPFTAMRQESLLRTWLVLLVASMIPSLLLASTYADILADLVIPLGAPLTHIIHAMALFVVAVTFAAGLTSFRTRRAVVSFSKSVSVGPTVEAIFNDLSEKFTLRPEVRITGGAGGKDITSLVSGGRPLVLLPAGCLPEAKLNPAAFRFRLAHEFAHLGANDYRSDVWITSAYIVGAAFMLGAFGRVLWAIFESLLVGGRSGTGGVLFALQGSALPLATNTVAFGCLGSLLFLEHRAAMRLREFHADAVAIEVSGPNLSAFAGMAKTPTSGLRNWLYRLADDHPDARIRTVALGERFAAFRVDLIALIIQGFFAAIMLETALQLLLGGSSVDVSSLFERQVHLQAQLTQYPGVVGGIVGTAIVVCSVANFLVIRRMSMLQTPNGRWLATFIKICLLYALGSMFALFSSQTFLWEISNANWNAAFWATQDPERPAVYVTGILGFALAAYLTHLLSQKCTSPTAVALGVSVLPPLLQLSVAAFLLVPGQLH